FGSASEAVVIGLFFSSRRRHTRSKRDWSSDVCSSDLKIAAAADYVGVLCVEFFVLADGRLVANEIAPRPHNSGHHTIEACLSSQFEQQVRALAGLPLGATTLQQPAVMVNILGDSWFLDSHSTAPQTPD